MHRLLLIAGPLVGAIALAGVDEPAPVSSVHEALPREFIYAPPPGASDAPGSAAINVTGPVVEMTPFRIEEMRPRHARELEQKWAQQDRLRPKAIAVKSIGSAQFLAVEPPYLYEPPTPPSSNEVGGVMLTVPIGSLHW